MYVVKVCYKKHIWKANVFSCFHLLIFKNKPFETNFEYICEAMIQNYQWKEEGRGEVDFLHSPFLSWRKSMGMISKDSVCDLLYLHGSWYSQ